MSTVHTKRLSCSIVSPMSRVETLHPGSGTEQTDASGQGVEKGKARGLTVQTHGLEFLRMAMVIMQVPRLAIGSKDAGPGRPTRSILATSNKKLRSDSWHRYESGAIGRDRVKHLLLLVSGIGWCVPLGQVRHQFGPNELPSSLLRPVRRRKGSPSAALGVHEHVQREARHGVQPLLHHRLRHVVLRRPVMFRSRWISMCSSKQWTAWVVLHQTE